jgi:hypothetical protein
VRNDGADRQVLDEVRELDEKKLNPDDFDELPEDFAPYS